jgi:hypothetical protein
MIKGSLKPLIKRLEKKFSRFDGDLMLKIGLGINSIIQERTQNEGRGSKGGKMPLYSRSYARKRQRTGRITRSRDLTYTGKMWTSLTATRISKKKVKLHFAGADENNKARYNDERTPFFSLGKKGRAYLRSELNNFNKK